jgi:hypothetical protein
MTPPKIGATNRMKNPIKEVARLPRKDKSDAVMKATG